MEATTLREFGRCCCCGAAEISGDNLLLATSVFRFDDLNFFFPAPFPFPIWPLPLFFTGFLVRRMPFFFFFLLPLPTDAESVLDSFGADGWVTPSPNPDFPSVSSSFSASTVSSTLDSVSFTFVLVFPPDSESASSVAFVVESPASSFSTFSVFADLSELSLLLLLALLRRLLVA